MARPNCSVLVKPCSLPDAQLSQAVFVNAEVVADFVEEGLLCLLHHFFFAAAVELVGALVDDDAVREDHGVAVRAVREADAGVDAEEAASAADAGLAELVDAWTPAYLDIDVVEGGAELRGKLVQRLLDDALEFAPFHLASILSCGFGDNHEGQI